MFEAWGTFRGRWAGSRAVVGRVAAGLGWSRPLMLLAGAPVAGRPVAELLELLAGWDRQMAWIAGQQTKLIHRIAGAIRSDCAQERREQEARGLTVALTDQTIENEIEAEIATAVAARAHHGRPPGRGRRSAVQSVDRYPDRIERGPDHVLAGGDHHRGDPAPDR